jgi:uncharacterized membrane protein (DUF4010 family)
VVVLAGISWAGYIATRVAGAKRGLLMTGLAGGFISASATTAAMGRVARASATTKPATAAALVASVATMVEMIAIIAYVSPAVALRLAVPLTLGALALAGVSWLLLRGDHREAHEVEAWSGRPFQLVPVLTLAALLTVTLLVGRALSHLLGPRGAIVAAGASGLADAHAGAIAAATLHAQGTLPMSITLYAVAASLVANTIVKCLLALLSGGGRFAAGFSWRIGAVTTATAAGILAVGALA